MQAQLVIWKKFIIYQKNLVFYNRRCKPRIRWKYKDTNVGECKFSDITIFSFHPVKIITTAEGGMATTNSNKIAQKICKLRSHGITKDPNKFKYKNEGDWHYEQNSLGFNYRLNDLQAALGKVN